MAMGMRQGQNAYKHAETDSQRYTEKQKLPRSDTQVQKVRETKQPQTHRVRHTNTQT